MKNLEDIKIQQNAIDYLREHAVRAEQQAFTFLQMSDCENEQMAYCAAMEHWKSVQILLAQRDKLQKYVRLLIKTDCEDLTVNAVKEYLEQIGIEP
jgi:hypothetical protein